MKNNFNTTTILFWLGVALVIVGFVLCYWSFQVKNTRNTEYSYKPLPLHKAVHFGVEQVCLFKDDIVIDCVTQKVKSQDAPLNLKDVRYTTSFML